MMEPWAIVTDDYDNNGEGLFVTTTRTPGAGARDGEAPVFPAGRYGRRRDPRRARRRALPLLVTLGAVVGLLVAVALYQRYRPAEYQGQLLRFDVRSASQAQFQLQVSKPAGRPAECSVQALAYDHSAVGQTRVAIPPGPSGSTTATVTASLRTSAKAYTGEVLGCGPTTGK
jgi:hypothetical protein